MSRSAFLFRVVLSVLASEICVTGGSAQENSGALREVAFAQLSDRTVGALGQAALSVRPGAWKHAETKNFVYHYFHGHVAGPVSVEAEFYYGVIAREIEKETAQWERKSHVFIFEEATEWTEFQNKGALDPWTGGVHAAGELFIRRDPSYKWQGDTLGHEIAHLVVHRFFGNGVPLWLNEGYAEYAAARGYAAFHRARGYRARPRSRSLAPSQFIPLSQLTTQLTYPQDSLQVHAFYIESERLARFLSSVDKRGFGIFFEALSKGNHFSSALAKGFGARFSHLEALEGEFKAYASKDHDASLSP